MFLESLHFSFSIIGPICLLLFLGWFLRKTNTINDAFIEIGSKLVFKVTLPALLFLSIIKTNRDIDINFSLIIYSVIANFVFFLLTVLLTRYWVKDKSDHGVIVQGAFRSNIAIIGLAYVANVYGDAGIAVAAIYVAFHTMLYNILSVIILTPKQEGVKSITIFGVVKSIAKNPLIIGISLGIVFFIFAIPVPKVLINTGQYFSNMTLPLALLCTGGSLNLKALKYNGFNCRFSSILKIVIGPIFITGGAYLFGFTGTPLGLVFFMSASPTAAASYVMARAMGHNADLAANIVAMTTIGSLLTCSLGVSLLYWLQLI
ncbi:AEC family transporter [Psychromonas sp. RZ22]|uniref:AEC family transporter n=1 Tax=Psychromonas algarum TaxID=2555643 RepID=UPI0010683785|nr:AEC family transporter [Psychromonas sp. RZ22]TEW56210.1 AEC family transporter [Psychromonas sp. RZ22]